MRKKIIITICTVLILSVVGLIIIETLSPTPGDKVLDKIYIYIFGYFIIAFGPIFIVTSFPLYDNVTLAIMSLLGVASIISEIYIIKSEKLPLWYSILPVTLWVGIGVIGLYLGATV